MTDAHSPGPDESTVQRADGEPIDGGHTFIDAGELVKRLAGQLEHGDRQVLAAAGVYVGLLTGFGAWRRGFNVQGSVATIAKAFGISHQAAGRSLDDLEAVGLVTRTSTGWRIDQRLLPRASGKRLKTGTRALRLVHREAWTTLAGLRSRDSVSAYHHLRDLGAELLALAAGEAGVSITVRADARTLRRRVARMVAAGLRPFQAAIRRAVKALAPPAEGAQTTGPPPAEVWETLRSRIRGPNAPPATA